MSPTVSSENVENVVKPPQNPAFQKDVEAGDNNCVRIKHPAINPMINAPNTLTMSVATGNNDDDDDDNGGNCDMP